MRPEVPVLQTSHKNENKDDDEHQPDAAGRIIPPARAVWPGWQRAHEDQDQNDQQNGSERHGHLPVLQLPVFEQPIAPTNGRPERFRRSGPHGRRNAKRRLIKYFTSFNARVAASGQNTGTLLDQRRHNARTDRVFHSARWARQRRRATRGPQEKAAETSAASSQRDRSTLPVARLR